MAAALSVRSATGTVVEKLTFAHVQVTGADDNTAAGAERRYYILAEAPAGAHDNLRSHVFSPSQDGKHTWDNVLFPVDGSWTLRLRDVSNDSNVATLSVTVSNPA